ncbi:MAG: nitroreductase family protein [Vicinamibacterales bacterium]
MNDRHTGESLERQTPRAAHEAMRDLQADVRLRRDRGPDRGDAAPAWPAVASVQAVDAAAVERTVILLPQPRTAGSIADVMQQRVSVRHFAREPVALDQIAAVLKAAAAGDAREWPLESARPLQLRLLAWRVSGLPAGVYSYGGERHVLRFDGPAPDPVVDGPDLTLQPEFAEAPFILFITGNLAAALRAHGSAGYPQLLLRGGSAGQRAWLAAIGAALCGVTFAGFLPAAASHYLGANGYEACCLLAFAGGRPADNGSTPVTARVPL